MLKKTISYTNYNGQQRVRDLYFNLNKYEFTQMLVGEDNVPFQDYLQQLVDTRDASQMVRVIKDILLLAYGIKSSDGERFEKSDQLRKEFEESAAFSECYIQLAQDNAELLKFVWGIMPPDLRPDESIIRDIMSNGFNNPTQTDGTTPELTIVTEVTDAKN